MAPDAGSSADSRQSAAAHTTGRRRSRCRTTATLEGGRLTICRTQKGHAPEAIMMTRMTPNADPGTRKELPAGRWFQKSNMTEHTSRSRNRRARRPPKTARASPQKCERGTRCATASSTARIASRRQPAAGPEQAGRRFHSAPSQGDPTQKQPFGGGIDCLGVIAHLGPTASPPASIRPGFRTGRRNPAGLGVGHGLSRGHGRHAGPRH